ncbi:PiggyBac transposable element-derived protein 3 [Trichinella nelsoni]|uniref:PiggyBac transposable element-derived protein 3 n=1 Tax=Trichinella nelsoni TaxID=6336 RepID=A0A0V0SHJ0_9BILA|nr:PiggyBac transposable element-derived protein 3 [Trichinella nelsoni]
MISVLKIPENMSCTLTTSLPHTIFWRNFRAFFDHVCNSTVYVCRWNDNAVVTLASNHLTHHPIGSVQRYSQSQKKHTLLLIESQ